jgi:hypothetical protein
MESSLKQEEHNQQREEEVKKEESVQVVPQVEDEVIENDVEAP